MFRRPRRLAGSAFHVTTPPPPVATGSGMHSNPYVWGSRPESASYHTCLSNPLSSYAMPALPGELRGVTLIGASIRVQPPFIFRRDVPGHGAHPGRHLLAVIGGCRVPPRQGNGLPHPPSESQASPLPAARLFNMEESASSPMQLRHRGKSLRTPSPMTPWARVLRAPRQVEGARMPKKAKVEGEPGLLNLSPSSVRAGERRGKRIRPPAKAAALATTCSRPHLGSPPAPSGQRPPDAW
ncbi:hypothetical protein NDU88_005499 [Pleurodeles waltl]|uniref:Uncharacterized protein n=1 Tax=Pleurodeles waltl TaxID=8319 RepID=A0AAV7TUG0_PLEWA|nr:hypothetical protein NDU88_005499 [Pleurodeles waltl]